MLRKRLFPGWSWQSHRLPGYPVVALCTPWGVAELHLIPTHERDDLDHEPDEPSRSDWTLLERDDEFGVPH